MVKEETFMPRKSGRGGAGKSIHTLTKKWPGEQKIPDCIWCYAITTKFQHVHTILSLCNTMNNEWNESYKNVDHNKQSSNYCQRLHYTLDVRDSCYHATKPITQV